MAETIREEQDYYTCAKSGCDLRGEPIPEKYREWHGGATHYSKVIGIYDRARDRTVEFKCPVCGEHWARE